MAELTALEHDFDVTAADYVADPYPVWDEMRTTRPVAHTDRHGGAWITTTYEDVTRVARDPGVFSSRDVSVIPAPDSTEGDLLPAGLPPIQSDPPVHTWSRRLVLPWFSHAHTVVAMSESRRTESFWTRSTISVPDGGPRVASVLLHQGVFKDSYPHSPRPESALEQ